MPQEDQRRSRIANLERIMSSEFAMRDKRNCHSLYIYVPEFDKFQYAI